jgi:hypothetical protein
MEELVPAAETFLQVCEALLSLLPPLTSFHVLPASHFSRTDVLIAPPRFEPSVLEHFV